MHSSSPFISILFSFTLSITLIQASLFSPHLLSYNSSIFNDYPLRSGFTVVELYADLNYLYILSTDPFGDKVLWLSSYSEGGMNFERYQLPPGNLSMAVIASGAVVCGTQYYSNASTSILLVNSEAKVNQTTILDDALLTFNSFYPTNTEYAMYGVPELDSNELISSIYLFPWDNGTVNLDPQIMSIPPSLNVIMSSSNLYTISENGEILCSYNLPYVNSPVACINIVLTTNNTCACNQDFTLCCKVSISPSGNRLFIEAFYSTVLLIFDVLPSEINLFEVINLYTASGYSLTSSTISYYGDFFIKGNDLYDISNGKISTIHDFVYIGKNLQFAFSPDNRLTFVVSVMLDIFEDTKVALFCWDTTPSLSPTLLATSPQAYSSANQQSFVVMDESLGLAFSVDTFLEFTELETLDTVPSWTFYPGTLEGVASLFKELNCLYFSTCVNAYSQQWSVSFFTFDTVNQTIANVVSINNTEPFRSPVAQKLWMGPLGDLYIVVFWAYQLNTSFAGNSPVTIEVFHIPQNSTLPTTLSSPVASLNLGPCITANLANLLPFFGTVPPMTNLYIAIWSNDVTTAENLTYTGGLNFSVVVQGGKTKLDALNFRWLNFSYVDSTQTLSVTQNTSVDADCILMQSVRKNNSTWVLCIQLQGDLEYYYQIRQYTNNIYEPATTILLNIQYQTDSYVSTIGWWISNDEQRLAIVNISGIYMYDIPSQKIIYSIDDGYPYLTGGIYHITTPSSGYVLVLSSTYGTSYYYDCDPGFKPNLSHYCTRCVSGYFGYGCIPCTPGYICEGDGLAEPSAVCPPGYYCEEGTSSSTRGDPNGPQPCLAGSYCAEGMGTYEVGTDRASPKPCEAGFYCPANSTLPTAAACPAYTSSLSGAKSILDCMCNSGYFGYAGHCTKCPNECNCYGDVIIGCWTDANTSTSEMPVMCPVNSVLGVTACNPNGTTWNGNTTFPCAQGYSNRQCSKCEHGYYANGRACAQCNDLLRMFLPVAYCVVPFILLVYAWNVQPANSATIKIVTVHFQTLITLVIGGMEWDSLSSNFIHSSSSSFSFSLSAIECLIPHWNIWDSLVVAVFLPIGVGILAVTAGIVVWMLRRSGRRISVLVRRSGNLDTPLNENYHLRLQVVKTITTLTDLLYFSIALQTFQIFGCTVNSYDGVYLASHPWLQCGSKYWVSLLSIALVAVVLEILLPPIILMVALRKNKHELMSPKTKAVLGTFYMVYSPDHYFWEGIIICRRLIIAALSAIIPYGSILLFVGLFIVFHMYAVVLLRKMPYLNPRDNLMDIASQCILLTTLYCGFFVDFSWSNYYQMQLSVFAGVANLIFLMFGISCIFIEKMSWVRKLYELRAIARFKARRARKKPPNEREALLVNN